MSETLERPINAHPPKFHQPKEPILYSNSIKDPDNSWKEELLFATATAVILLHEKRYRDVWDIVKHYAFLGALDTLSPEEKKNLHLAEQSYGHEDVLDILRGIKPKEDPDNPEELKRKTLVIVMGGGNGANKNAGTLRGMQKAGALDRVDGYMGISAGIPCILYTECDLNEEGVKIFQDDNSKEGHFVRLPRNIPKAITSIVRLLRNGAPKALVDTRTCENAMRNTRPLDIEKIKASAKEILAVVLNTATGKAEYIDVKTSADPVSVARAGICMEAFDTDPDILLENGQRYADAGVADPIPLKEAFLRGYTDVLIISNYPLVANENFFAQRMQPLALRILAKNKHYKYSQAVVEAYRNYNKTVTNSFKYVDQVIRENNPNRRVAVISPAGTEMTGMLEMDRDLLVRAYQQAIDFAELELTHTSSEASKIRYSQTQAAFLPKAG